LRFEADDTGGPQAAFTLKDPEGHSIGMELLNGQERRGERRYRIDKMCADWQQQYKFEEPTPMWFGTPPAALTVALDALYVYPEENLTAAINFHVASGSLSSVHCRIVLKTPSGEQELLPTGEVWSRLWQSGQPRPAMLDNGYADARDLLPLSIPAEKLPRHPFNHPVRDCQLVVTLLDSAGKTVATHESTPFGCIETPQLPGLPEKITRTEVNKSGTILVNGRPYVFNMFPVNDKMDLGNISRLVNFPPTHKILPLPFPKELIFNDADEPAWKEKVEAFVRANKHDPKLFAYHFAHNGETSFWFDQWKQMAACQAKVTGWVRQLDPNHMVMSAHWLFGHGALTPEAAEPFGFLNTLDVEPGLTWTPDSRAVRGVTKRPVAVIAGLETYYFQSLEVLRWRTYEALRQGANGIGICPSGMLRLSAEKVSFLRGLAGEINGLEGAIVGPEPSEKTTCEQPAITVWEKQDGKTRYVIAMRGAEPGTGPVEAQLTLPKPAASVGVQFEGRTLAAPKRSFKDSFDTPYTVHVYRVNDG
jgi:hypothetical protein